MFISCRERPLSQMHHCNPGSIAKRDLSLILHCTVNLIIILWTTIVIMDLEKNKTEKNMHCIMYIYWVQSYDLLRWQRLHTCRQMYCVSILLLDVLLHVLLVLLHRILQTLSEQAESIFFWGAGRTDYSLDYSLGTVLKRKPWRDKQMREFHYREYTLTGHWHTYCTCIL